MNLSSLYKYVIRSYKMIETLQAGGEFERKREREIEKKYLPLFPERLNIFHEQAKPIEQLYLSHPDENFSLRLRETSDDEQLVYSATLKDRGVVTKDGLDRLEIETLISAETYMYYKNLGFPSLKKLRAEPYKNVVIDWFEDGHVQAEAEHPISWTGFLEQHRLRARDFVDMTGDRLGDNEWRAHLDFRRLNNGEEPFVLPPNFDSHAIANRIQEQYRHSSMTVVTVGGRSGSGKSTTIQEVRSLLTKNGIQSIILSTDDYNRGRTWLENYSGHTWSNWELPIVYDLELLQADLRQLRAGNDIPQRYIDFTTEEPAISGVIRPAPVVLIEGIYANDTSLDHIAQLRYKILTPLATCLGRRILRDVNERPGFADASHNLKYMLEVGEPAYRANAIRE